MIRCKLRQQGLCVTISKHAETFRWPQEEIKQHDRGRKCGAPEDLLLPCKAKNLTNIAEPGDGKASSFEAPLKMLRARIEIHSAR